MGGEREERRSPTPVLTVKLQLVPIRSFGLGASRVNASKRR